MTASAEYAWPSAAPGAVNPRGPGGPQQLRLARLPQDATHHESLIGGDGLRLSAAEVRDFTGLLPGLLLGIACHEAGRRSGAVPLPGSGIDHVARPAAAAALQAIAGNLDGFGGSSELMRWASKFVMRELSVRIGCLLRDAGVYALDRGDAGRLPGPPGGRLLEPPGCQSAESSDWPSLFAGLSRAIDMSLSRQQRTAFMSIAVNAVPADVLAAELRTSRSAVYKALFEARRTLRTALAAGGLIPRTVPGPLSGSLPGLIATGPRWLDDLLAADMGDAGCELTFVHLDRYAEAQLSGHEPRTRFRGVAVHLRGCPACHEDLTGLLLAFRPQDLPDS